MPVKNVIAHLFSPVLDSGDGYKYTAWPLGNKPGNNPIILYSDFVAGPISGGENGKGAYLSLYGFNFGNFADYLSGNNHVFIGGSEVDNYRCLVPAVGSGLNDKRGVYETMGIMELRMQVGSLGNPTAGVALNITMSVKGRGLGNRNTAGQYYDYASGAALTWTPQPGAIIFVDPVHGNDANPGTFALPLKNLQSSSAHTTGAIQGANSSTDTSGSKPGTHYYLRGGTYTPTGTTSTGNYGMWANLFRVSGTAPTGGTNRGPICITSYPGASGANSPEKAKYIASSGINASGGFFGNDQQRSSALAAETCPFDGQPGWGRWIHFSDLSVVCAPDGPRDGGPFVLNSSGDYWRVINCEGSWNSTTTGTGGAKAAGASGNGYHVVLAGNWFHDINGDTSANQNHGFYLDGSVKCCFDMWVAFNCVQNIGAGNGVQSFNIQAADTNRSIFVHSNWIETVNKHGLNASDSTRTRYDWNNVVIDCGEAGYHMNSAAVIDANGMQCFNNTFYGWGRLNTARGCFWNDGGTGSGGNTYIRYNICIQKASNNAPFSILDGTGSNVLSTNCYFDEAGVQTVPSGDATAIFADPKVVSRSGKDFRLTFGSPCINAAAAPVTTRNFDAQGFQILDTPDLGAYEYGSYL